MKTGQIILNENKLELLVKKPSHFVTIFLLSAASLCFIIPFIYLINLLIQTGGGAQISNLTFFFSLVPIFFSLYLFKIFFWNLFGKEIYTFENDKISLYRDYKYFKESKKYFKTKGLKIRTEMSGYENEKKAVLIFENKESKYKSQVELPEKELIELKELLDQKIN